MFVRQLFDRASSTFTYLIADPATKGAALVDPVREHLERDLTLVAELGFTLRLVLETHVHADHVTASGALRMRTGARTVASPNGAPCADVRLGHGETVALGSLTVTALETPGHTDDGLSFLVGGQLFTGDTLLIRTCGRTDFQNGDPAALHRSLHDVLFALPDDTTVWPGHDYRGFSSSTIGEERRFNARAAGRTEEQFVTLMNGLSLPPPAQLAVAVPANRACGEIAS